MPPPRPLDPAFALALLEIEGVGRATANRILARFSSPEELAATPREQVLVRLKGTPAAAAVVQRLLEPGLRDGVATWRKRVEALASRRVIVVAPGHPHWPAGLDALAPAHRPVVMWAYGNTACLTGPTVAVLGPTPLPHHEYELAQALTRRLLAEAIVPVVGLRPGFDVALHRMAAAAGRPLAAVAPCGLARVDGSVRSSATSVVRAGGLLVSSFPMDHGPFEHDEVERGVVQAAIARVTCAFAPAAGGPEGRALVWAAANGRPAFVAGEVPVGAESSRSLEAAGALDGLVESVRAA
jgi:predicted Rossmann fold nucleotide-binding protein DprA/Smf involved in DNA uptake